MPYNAGTAYLQIVPSFRDIEKNIVGELRKVARQFGDELEKSLPKAMTDALEKASKDAGKNAGKAAETIAKNHADAVKRINQAAGDEQLRQARTFAKKQGDIYTGLETLRRKRAELALREFDREKAQELKEEERAEAERIRVLERGAQERARIAKTIAAARLKAQAKVANDIQRAVEQQEAALAKAFDDAIKEDYRRRRASADVIRKAHEDAIKEDFLRRRAQWAAIEKAHEDAIREDYRRTQADLKAQADAAAKAAQKRLDDLRRQIQDRAKLLAKERADRQRADADAFSRSTAGRAATGVGSAMTSIQNIPIKLNDQTIDGEMQRIRARLEKYKDLKIGVNIDVEDFVDEARTQFERLRDIAKDVTVDINVRTDAAAAATELGGVLVLLNRLDGDDAKVTVNVDTDTARGRLLAMAGSIQVNLSRLGQLIALGAAVGSAIVPAAAVATAAIGAIGTAAAAASIGIGVMILGFGGVGDAVKALGQQADDLNKQNQDTVSSENAIANAVDGVTSARRALANTIATNRDAAIRANQAVADAERDLAKARRQAARDAEDAERRVAAARERAAEDAVQAARRVADAQRALARDEETAKRAREDLTEAYRDAQRAFEDLSSQMKHNSLDQQTALLDIADAKEKLDKLMSNPRATEEERQRAQIAYEERKLQLEDLQRNQAELNEDYDEYAVRGVEGSRQVEDAQRRVEDADRRVAEGRRELADAQKAQTKALLEGQRAISDALRDQQEQARKSAETIANAERSLANERRERDAQQRQAAFAIANAQQSLISAQRSLQSAYASAGTAGQAAADKVNTAMSKLSPVAQNFARFIFGLKDEFYALRNAAAEGLLTGLQTAIEMLLPRLPAITEFVRKVGFKLGQMFVDFATALKEPVFRDFFDYVKATAIPTMDLWFKVSMNLLRGFIGLFLGFTPLSEDVSGGVLSMSESFARWGTTLDKNQGFQNFLNYIRENGPMVMDFFGQFIQLGWNLIKALAPIGPVVITVFDALFNFLNSIPPDVLVAIVAGIAGLAAAISVMGAVTSALAISATAWIVGGVIAFVTAAVAGISLLLTRFAPLREFLTNLWRSILDGARTMWGYVQPILMDFWEVVVQLWRGAFLPALKGIWELVQQWWAILKPIVKNVGLVLMAVGAVVMLLWKAFFMPAFKLIANIITNVVVPVIRWFYNTIIKPVFAAVQVAVNVLSAVFKVAFGVVQIAIKAVGALFGAFYRLFIKPFLDDLEPFFNWLKGIIRDEVLPVWDKAMKALGLLWKMVQDMAKKPVRFIVETLLNEGILKGYNKLADMFDVEPKNVKIPPPRGGWATGGVVDVLPGYSPGVDDHTFYSPTGGVIGLSGGEGILRPEVTALVRPWLDEANLAARQGGRRGAQKFLGGFKNGGVIPRGAGDGLGSFWDAARNKGKDLWKGLTDKASDVFEGIKDFASNPAGYLKRIATSLINLVPGKDTAFVKGLLGLPRKFLTSLTDKVKQLFLGADAEGGNGTPGSAGGLGGSQGMMRILRGVFPGLPLISGFRPGAITATGNPSYHGQNRAVDLPPRMDVFNWIRENFRNSREIIFSPAGARQIHNGQPHVYSGITKRMHYNHVHWAYDDGGWLPDTRQMPGQMMSVFHGRRQPDAVLSNAQWESISRVARQSMVAGGGRGDVYNFDFEKSALTADRLASIQSRRDTLDRVARPNR